MLDIEKLSISKNNSFDNLAKDTKPPRHTAGEKFLKGPIPWNWICKASKLPGKALAVALAIYHLAFILNSRTVKLQKKITDEMGIKRITKYRAITALQNAGLISAIIHRGRLPVITILELERHNDV